MSAEMSLRVLPGSLAIGKLESQTSLPRGWLAQPFASVVRTGGELSIVCSEDLMPVEATSSAGWRALQVVGPLDLSLTGVMASLSTALAQAAISLFAVSSYDTDTLLVRAENLERAIQALEACGHRVERDEG